MAYAIAGQSAPPRQLIEHTYRKLFGITHEQLMKEPAHLITEALVIEELLHERQQDEIKAMERSNG